MNPKLGILKTVVMIAGMSLVIISCASSKPPVCEDHPGWVEKGGGFFSGDRTTAIYGVGVANVNENTPISILRTAADARARADVAQAISMNVQTITKTYSSSVSDGERAEMEELIKNALIAFTKLQLTGAAIVDHHNCPRDQGYYALCRMAPEEFANTIRSIPGLDARAVDVIERNAQAMFDEMSRRAEQTP